MTWCSKIGYKYKLVKNGKYLNSKNYDFDVKVRERRLEDITYLQSNYPGSEIQSDEILFGKWFNWGFFRCRAYKKGTVHFEFLSDEVWSKFNQTIAQIKGFPLYESAANTSKKKKPKPADV